MPNSTTIPADAIPGLLVGWTGPVDYLDYEAAENGETDEPEWSPAIVNALGMVWYEAEDCSWRPVYRERPELRLDCLRPEVQARVGRMLAAGVGCECARLDEAQPDNPRSGVVDPYCPDCKGSGWTRKPSPIHHILDSARTNALSPQHIAEAVAWSVRSVVRGGEVLHKVYLDIGALRRDYLRDTATEAIVAALDAGNGFIDGGALVLPGEQS